MYKRNWVSNQLWHKISTNVLLNIVQSLQNIKKENIVFKNEYLGHLTVVTKLSFLPLFLVNVSLIILYSLIKWFLIKFIKFTYMCLLGNYSNMKSEKNPLFEILCHCMCLTYCMHLFEANTVIGLKINHNVINAQISLLFHLLNSLFFGLHISEIISY